jgi:hypothetical protein
MGSNGFGARSSKGAGMAGEAAGMWNAHGGGSLEDAIQCTPVPGLSEAALRQHDQNEQQQQGSQQRAANGNRTVDVGASQRLMTRLSCEPIAEHDG